MIQLREIQPSDIEVMYKWEIDEQLQPLVGIETARSKDEFYHDYEKYFIKHNDQLTLFAIIHNGKTVGRIEIFALMDEDGIAYMGMLIGEGSFRHQGIGTKAIELLKRQYISTMNIKEIMVEVYDYNKASIAFFEKIGFQRTGTITTESYREKEVPLIQLTYVYEG